MIPHWDRQRGLCIVRYIILLSSSLSGFAQGEAAGAAPSTSDPQRDAATFAKVLEASLNAANIGQWEGSPFGVRSPFDRNVSGEYIPSVGILIRLHVSFEIVPPKGAGEAQQEEVSEDLWEQYAASDNGLAMGTFAAAGSAGLSGGGSAARENPTVGPRTVEARAKPAPTFFSSSNSDPDPAGAKLEISTTAVAPANAGLAATEVQKPSVAGGQGQMDPAAGMPGVLANPAVGRQTFVIGVPATQQSSYSKERVTKLEDTVLATIGRYGHRISGLKPEERLLVIVEAPSVPEVIANSIVAMGGGLAGGAMPGKLELRAAVPGRTDHWLVTVPQSALVAELKKEDVTAKVEQVRY